MPTYEDAEDVASEAMLRAATYEGLDLERLPQFLTAVTIRLSADVYRTAERGTRLARRLGIEDERSPEDLACEASDAAAVRELVGTLPDSQRNVLVDRAYGLSVTQISQRHALSYKAVESALSRARATMRSALASAMALAAAAAASLRRRPEIEVALPAATVAFVTAVVAPFVHQRGVGGDPVSLPARPAAPIVRSDDRTPRPAPGVPAVAAAPRRPRSATLVPAPARPAPRPEPSPSFEIAVGDGEERVPVIRDEDGILIPRDTVRKCVEHGPVVEPTPTGWIGPVRQYQVMFDCHA